MCFTKKVKTIGILAADTDIKTERWEIAGRYFLPNCNLTAKSVNSKVYRKAPRKVFTAGLYKGAFRILF